MWEACACIDRPNHVSVYARGSGRRPTPRALSACTAALYARQALHDDLDVSEPPPELPPLRSELFAELLLRGLRNQTQSRATAPMGPNGPLALGLVPWPLA